MPIRYVIFTLSVAFFAIYALKRDYDTPPTVDPALEVYVNEWKRDMDSAGISYLGVFNQIDNIILYDGPEYGLSHIRKIKINRKLLESEWLLRQTVYHELGHNVFDLKHGAQLSIMHAQDLGESFYKNNWDQIKIEYIRKCKGE